MMKIKVQCPTPSCGQYYGVAAAQLGKKGVCKHCGREFTLVAVSNVLGKPPAGSELRANPSLDAANRLGTSDAGRSVLPAKAMSPTPNHVSARRETAAIAGSQIGTVGAGSQPTLDGTPQRIGRFEIRGRLGAGAFGAVYRAYDPQLAREVALKVPHTATLQSEKARLRFLIEAKAAAKLHHPNVVPVYETGQDGDACYIASAFIEGQTLEDAIHAQRPDFGRAAKIVMDLAGALDYAHKLKIIHRDIKPANILLDANGEPLVMDFGLARLDAEQSRLTIEGALLGTPAYMSPEQASRSNEQVGPTSDQYSLGVVLYELLCGEPPFSGPPGAILALVVSEEPPAPRSIYRQIPKDLETICLKAMAKDPSHRYRDCTLLADDLRRWLSNEPIQARPVGTAEKTYRWAKRNPAKAALWVLVPPLICLALFAIQQHTAVQDVRDIQHYAETKTEELQQNQKLLERTTEAAKTNPYLQQRLQELQ